MPNAPSPAAPQTITLPVDAAHSMLSVLFMLAPSPAWFTGVESLDLCVDGYWRSRSLSAQPSFNVFAGERIVKLFDEVEIELVVRTDRTPMDFGVRFLGFVDAAPEA